MASFAFFLSSFENESTEPSGLAIFEHNSTKTSEAPLTCNRVVPEVEPEMAVDILFRADVK
jgi:hypothetical protein